MFANRLEMNQTRGACDQSRSFINSELMAEAHVTGHRKPRAHDVRSSRGCLFAASVASPIPDFTVKQIPGTVLPTILHHEVIKLQVCQVCALNLYCEMIFLLVVCSTLITHSTNLEISDPNSLPLNEAYEMFEKKCPLVSWSWCERAQVQRLWRSFR